MGRTAGSSSTSLAPGFRFHPTDEELVSYYLRRKVSGKPLRFDAIADVEVYKSEPWDLPGLSKLRTRDLEWYFFSALDKKYGNGSRTNRATVEGYWKTTGKDRSVQHRSRLVGMKKTLVYHHGRAPRGERTNWVMHEYKLVDEELEKAGTPQEALVLCRIFRKSGSGPKNGEQYGAPFIEEEWEEDDEVAVLPCDTIADEMLVTGELVEGNDLDQDHVAEVQPQRSISPLNFHQGETSNFVQDSQEFLANDLEPSTEVHEDRCSPTSNNDTNCINPSAQAATTITQNDFNPQPPSIAGDAPTGCLPVEQYFDIINSGDGFFLEANDLSEPIGASRSDLELFYEYMAYFDAEDDIAQYLNFNTSELLDANNTILTDQAHCTTENLDQGTGGASTSSQQFSDSNGADAASSSNEAKQAPQPEPNLNYPFMKQTSQMLGTFPAPPASASEFPTKEVQAQLHAALQSSGTSHYTSGVSRIINNSETQRPFYKSGRVNVVLSFDMPDAIVSPTFLETISSTTSGKATSVLPRSWLYFFFFLWAAILAVTAKVGTCIYAK